jgi:hypothetical protein
VRYVVLACDYDGPLARAGQVDAPTVAALERVRAAGRKLVLVTGRELADLQRVFPHLDLFDRAVAENGAVLYRPATREERLLAEPCPPALVEALRRHGVTPLSVGRAIVATWQPHETTVLAVIRALGLERQVIYNQGAVMVLPPGVNKASGLLAALAELRLSPHNAVGIGDAENDHAFLSTCACGVAVANALPLLKERADHVTRGARGQRVQELVAQLLADDLAAFAPVCGGTTSCWGTTSPGSRCHCRPTAPRCCSPGPRAVASRRRPPPYWSGWLRRGTRSASSIPRATTRRSPGRSR